MGIGRQSGGVALADTCHAISFSTLTLWNFEAARMMSVRSIRQNAVAVPYTHLTLPTKRLV